MNSSEIDDLKKRVARIQAVLISDMIRRQGSTQDQKNTMKDALSWAIMTENLLSMLNFRGQIEAAGQSAEWFWEPGDTMNKATMEETLDTIRQQIMNAEQNMQGGIHAV